MAQPPHPPSIRGGSHGQSQLGPLPSTSAGLRKRPRAAAAPGTNRLPQEKPAHPGAPELVLRDPETWSPREFHLQPLRWGTTSKRVTVPSAGEAPSRM